MGHLHLIQNKQFDMADYVSPDSRIFDTSITNHSNPIQFPMWQLPTDTNSDTDTTSYVERMKSYSVQRFLVLWGEFLKRPEAKADPQYKSIEKIYKTATKSLKR